MKGYCSVKTRARARTAASWYSRLERTSKDVSDSRELDYSVSVGEEMRGIKGNKHPEFTKLTYWYSEKEEVRPEGWYKDRWTLLHGK